MAPCGDFADRRVLLRYVSLVARTRQIGLSILKRRGALLLAAEGTNLIGVFASSAAAVEAGCELQSCLAAFNRALPDEEDEFALLLGCCAIDFGDAPFVDRTGKFYGDAFSNAYLMLEELCDVGLVCVSAAAATQAGGDGDASRLSFFDLSSGASYAENLSELRQLIDELGGVYVAEVSDLDVPPATPAEQPEPWLQPAELAVMQHARPHHSHAEREDSLGKLASELVRSRVVMSVEFDVPELLSSEEEVREKFLGLAALQDEMRRHGGHRLEEMLYGFAGGTEALCAALACRRSFETRGVKLKGCGIHAGEMLHLAGTDIHWGENVTLASMLAQSVAADGDVLVSEEVAAMCRLDARTKGLDYASAEAELECRCYRVTGEPVDVASALASGTAVADAITAADEVQESAASVNAAAAAVVTTTTSVSATCPSSTGAPLEEERPPMVPAADAAAAVSDEIVRNVIAESSDYIGDLAPQVSFAGGESATDEVQSVHTRGTAVADAITAVDAAQLLGASEPVAATAVLGGSSCASSSAVVAVAAVLKAGCAAGAAESCAGRSPTLVLDDKSTVVAAAEAGPVEAVLKAGCAAGAAESCAGKSPTLVLDDSATAVAADGGEPAEAAHKALVEAAVEAGVAAGAAASYTETSPTLVLDDKSTVVADEQAGSVEAAVKASCAAGAAQSCAETSPRKLVLDDVPAVAGAVEAVSDEVVHNIIVETTNHLTDFAPQVSITGTARSVSMADQEILSESGTFQGGPVADIRSMDPAINAPAASDTTAALETVATEAEVRPALSRQLQEVVSQVSAAVVEDALSKTTAAQASALRAAPDAGDLNVQQPAQPAMESRRPSGPAEEERGAVVRAVVRAALMATAEANSGTLPVEERGRIARAVVRAVLASTASAQREEVVGAAVRDALVSSACSPLEDTGTLTRAVVRAVLMSAATGLLDQQQQQQQRHDAGGATVEALAAVDSEMDAVISQLRVDSACDSSSSATDAADVASSVVPIDIHAAFLSTVDRAAYNSALSEAVVQTVVTEAVEDIGSVAPPVSVSRVSTEGTSASAAALAVKPQMPASQETTAAAAVAAPPAGAAEQNAKEEEEIAADAGTTVAATPAVVSKQIAADRLPAEPTTRAAAAESEVVDRSGEKPTQTGSSIMAQWNKLKFVKNGKVTKDKLIKLLLRMNPMLTQSELKIALEGFGSSGGDNKVDLGSFVSWATRSTGAHTS
eukprot:TRINITY_DN40134_c0_g1_i2.p1 TRINITY_DN40134_c0_g1~~TRINITY_DN40134_c0_g1_i2.p1  ORF type:complete len:1301 (-),score=306.88 TRINITY_DN40134_c0_g1_i2:645-4316(-)